jgi:hypothetical protein
MDIINSNLEGAKLLNLDMRGVVFCNTKTPWGLDNSGCGK